jgi:hypothetical protein
MFVDNECRAMLDNIPKKYAIRFSTRMFSPSTGDAFLEFLRAIESSADEAHVAEVRTVYGEDWPRPFLAMYEVQRRMIKWREEQAGK